MELTIDTERKDEIFSVIQKNPLYTNETWHVTLYQGKWFLMKRTHDLGGTDYQYLMRLTEDESIFLVFFQDSYNIGDFSGQVRKIYDHRK